MSTQTKTISVIFGTRPEAIKLAPIILKFQKQPGIKCRVCVTGQHREMLDQILKAFSIVPDSDLNLMQANQTLASLTARLVEQIDRHLQTENPDLVVVQGDTTSVLCATLCSFYRRIPVAHVEAGLRTQNLHAPFPEEANRVLASRLARLHFAPTETALENLLREGVPSHHVFVTGNTVIDALFIALEKVRKYPPSVQDLPAYLQPSHLNSQPAEARPRIVLITGHRRENFGTGFESVCEAIIELADRFPDVHYIYPVHLNPNVRGPVNRILGPKRAFRQNVHLIEPLSYLPFVALMDKSFLILTDSGGVQEEAPSLGKPVLVMRQTTERPEAVQAGTVKLVGTDKKSIVRETVTLLTDKAAKEAMSRKYNPYGDGTAAARIVAECASLLCRETVNTTHS